MGSVPRLGNPTSQQEVSINGASPAGSSHRAARHRLHVATGPQAFQHNLHCSACHWSTLQTQRMFVCLNVGYHPKCTGSYHSSSIRFTILKAIRQFSITPKSHVQLIIYKSYPHSIIIKSPLQNIINILDLSRFHPISVANPGTPGFTFRGPHGTSGPAHGPMDPNGLGRNFEILNV